MMDINFKHSKMIILNIQVHFFCKYRCRKGERSGYGEKDVGRRKERREEKRERKNEGKRRKQEGGSKEDEEEIKKLITKIVIT